MSKKLALCLAAGGFLAGCGGGPSVPTVDFGAAGVNRPGVCAERQVTCDAAGRTKITVPRTFEDRTVSYVISRIAIPEANAMDQVAGFNLDNRDSGEGNSSATNCEEFAPDFTSNIDPNLPGVDNALESLVPTISMLLPAGMTLDTTLAEQIAEGTVLIILKVSGINDWATDDNVQVQLYRGVWPAAPAAPPMVGADGRLTAGQTYTVEALTDLSGAPVIVRGSILGGRLALFTDVLTIQITTSSFTLPLNVRNAQLRFNITETSLSNGVIGGSLLGQDLVDAAEMIMAGYGATVASVVEGIADIGPSAADMTICDSLSVGITFDATTAIIP